MNKRILSLLTAFVFAVSTFASSEDINRVTGLKVDRSTDRLLVNMIIDGEGLGKKSNRESWLTPVLTDTTSDGTVNILRLPSVMVGGRNRYYQALRNGVKVPIYRGGKINYAANVAWQPWMETAHMSLERLECGCCGQDTLITDTPLTVLDFVPRKFTAPLQYIAPLLSADDTVKRREIYGRAFIDFPVNRTEIYPDYRSNPRELAVIRATIDSVRQDPDITVRKITLKGYASPEGPYNNNVRLAKGRTEALKNYVQGLYHFPESVISTSFEPEDWEGLREFMLTSGLENRQAILDLIDSNLAPDAKDAALRRDFPKQYAFLLQEVYPALRHTDYTINYVIRNYSDPKEILQLVYTRPQNLSLSEFFLAAQNVPTGSPEYNYIFETAARMYPDDEVANLNAANAAMQQGAYENAEAYLRKAGDSADVIYARGVLAGMRGDYEQARTLLQQAGRLKVANAPEAISQLDEIIKHNARISGNSGGNISGNSEKAPN